MSETKEYLKRVLKELADALRERTPDRIPLPDAYWKALAILKPTNAQSETHYRIELTKVQLKVLSVATELLSRVMLGQWREILDWLPFQKDKNCSQFREDCNEISNTLSKYMHLEVDGYHSSLGIGNDYVHNYCSIAYDMHCSIRHELSWERAVEEGVIKDKDSPRKWPEMIGVDFDDPMKYSDEPLIEIYKV